MKFRTPNGTFTSTKATDMKFSLNEFSESRQVRWKFHILPENSKLPYYTIIGRDLTRKLKMDVLYSDNEVTWDELRLPMHYYLINVTIPALEVRKIGTLESQNSIPELTIGRSLKERMPEVLVQLCPKYTDIIRPLPLLLQILLSGTFRERKENA